MKKLISLIVMLSLITSCSSQEKGLKEDIITYITSIKNNDNEMFREVAINKIVAQKYLSNNVIDKNSKQYFILNTPDFIENNNLKYTHSNINSDDIETMLPNFAIKNEKTSEIVIYYYSSNTNNCNGVKVISVNVDNKNYFILSGGRGCGEYSISEMRTRFKTNLNIGFKFIDLNN